MYLVVHLPLPERDALFDLERRHSRRPRPQAQRRLLRQLKGSPRHPQPRRCVARSPDPRTVLGRRRRQLGLPVVHGRGRRQWRPYGAVVKGIPGGGARPCGARCERRSVESIRRRILIATGCGGIRARRVAALRAEPPHHSGSAQQTRKILFSKKKKKQENLQSSERFESKLAFSHNWLPEESRGEEVSCLAYLVLGRRTKENRHTPAAGAARCPCCSGSGEEEEEVAPSLLGHQ